jgi:hypothetical protein
MTRNNRATNKIFFMMGIGLSFDDYCIATLGLMQMHCGKNR